MTRPATTAPRRLAALALLPLLAACGASPFAPAEPEAPPPLPPQVLAALPPGVPPSVVTAGPDGCYLLTIERTDPPSGYPLTDAAGNRVCGAPAPA